MRTGRGTEWALWLALLVAFAPVLAELAASLPTQLHGWSALLAPILVLRVLRLDPVSAAPRRLPGLALLLLGLGLELVGVASGSWSIARYGLPLGVVGLSLWTGAVDLRAAVLAFWMVPLPSFLHALTTPHLESALAVAVAVLVAPLAVLDTAGPLLRHDGLTLELQSSHTGLHLAWVLALLGWYAAALRRRSLARCLASSAGWAVWALPGQLAAAWIAGLLLVAGRPGLGDAWLDHGVWLTAAALGVLRAELSAAEGEEP